jgi:hypothetical protein
MGQCIAFRPIYYTPTTDAFRMAGLPKSRIGMSPGDETGSLEVLLKIEVSSYDDEVALYDVEVELYNVAVELHDVEVEL